MAVIRSLDLSPIQQFSLSALFLSFKALLFRARIDREGDADTNGLVRRLVVCIPLCYSHVRSALRLIVWSS